MIIFNTPFRVKHFHKMFQDWISIYFLKENFHNKEAKFHFVYFSYRPDFEYLIMSIETLTAQFDVSVIGSINVFIDQKDPFDQQQMQQIKSISQLIEFHSVENFSWASKESTLSELKCFNKVVRNLNDSDMLVKTDSDILFFSSLKMVKILRSNIDAAGDGHSEDYKFAQGGLYLIRNKVIKNFLQNLEPSFVDEIVEKNGSPAEDRVISNILEISGNQFYFTRLMMFPSEYSKLSKISNFNRFDFCAAHFVKDKNSMASFRKLMNI